MCRSTIGVTTLIFGGDFRRQEFNEYRQQNPRGSFAFTGVATQAAEFVFRRCFDHHWFRYCRFSAWHSRYQRDFIRQSRQIFPPVGLRPLHYTTTGECFRSSPSMQACAGITAHPSPNFSEDSQISMSRRDSICRAGAGQQSQGLGDRHELSKLACAPRQARN